MLHLTYHMIEIQLYCTIRNKGLYNLFKSCLSFLVTNDTRDNYYCEPSKSFLDPKEICDGINDCKNNIDELNCNGT